MAGLYRGVTIVEIKPFSQIMWKMWGDATNHGVIFLENGDPIEAHISGMERADNFLRGIALV